MKKILYACLLLACSLLTGCRDKCQKTNTYWGVESFKVTLAEVRAAVKTVAAKDLVKTGKIYVKDKYLFINELRKGIHIIDNTNPSAPKNIAFVEIPGNVDMAVWGNILYADSYTDFVAIDISDPTNVKEVSRTKDVFLNGMIDGISWYYSATTGEIYDGTWKKIVTTQEVNCDLEPVYMPIYWSSMYLSYMSDKSISGGSSSASAATTGGGGTGGSMARFAFSDKYLYAVTSNEMKLFSIASPTQPAFTSSVNLGFGIETIFPYKDKLFIGTTTGLQIWNNQNPSSPTFLSRFDHTRACDPVVVQNDIAYVTLRSVDNFSRCGAAIANQLDVIDVSNAATPVLKKTYQLDGPYGLSIDQNSLFVCEGSKGLKSFDASNPLDLKLLQHFKDFDAYDVIALDKVLMVIGKNGLQQYDYSNKNQLKLLSTIPVKEIE